MSATAEAPPADRKLLRLSKAVEKLGISRATLYRLIESDDDFPKPVRLRGFPMFFADEVDAYLDRLAETREM